MPEIDRLWGGRLVSVAMEPVAWTLRFCVEVVEYDERRCYELVLEGVKQFHASRDVPLPWDYAELTEVHVAQTGTEVLVDLVMWADGTSLSTRCSRVSVYRIQSH